MSATRSPAWMPAAISPLASGTTSSRNWRAVTSCQPSSPPAASAPSAPPAALRRMMTASGSSAARRKTTSARLAVAGISTRAGVLYSRTAPPCATVPFSGGYRAGPAAPSAAAGVTPARAPRVGAMRVHVVSDVHGRADALARAGDGAQAVICLGDLLQFLDYADSRHGIFAELFGARQASKLIELRTAQRFDQARAFSRRLLAGLPGDPGEHFRAAAARQYDTLFAALPEPAYLTYGNVDLPGMWAARLKPGHRVLDGERAEFGGRTFGFVGGGLRSRYRTPHELDDDTYAAKIDAV